FRRCGSSLPRNSERYLAGLKLEVIDKNTQSAQQFISDLQSRESCEVIDPSRLYVPTWSQNDYRHFWGRVIEHLAARVIFLDGWELSNGCAYEYLVATTLNLPRLDSQLESID